jgi:hypothetical protein
MGYSERELLSQEGGSRFNLLLSGLSRAVECGGIFT